MDDARYSIDPYRVDINFRATHVEMTYIGPAKLNSSQWLCVGRYLTSKVTSSGLWSDGLTPFSSRVSKTCAERTTSAEAPLEKNT